MTEKVHPKLPSGQIVKWKEQDFPSVYVNIMGFLLTPFDIGLLLGEVGESTATEVTGIPKVKVLLTPEQAANLMKLLSVALKTYVSNNGQLRTSGAVNLEEIDRQIKDQTTGKLDEGK
jgi:hypothetical protein